MERDYDMEVKQAAQHVFDIMALRVSPKELQLIQKAYDLAYEAHKPQKRKSGEPYIIHPIAVANIAAEELKLDAHSVCAAFLHDVVEDTPYTVEDIEDMFGKDVAFLVDTVTKRKKDQYHTSKQVDNYEQLLASIHYDIRALMVKIADRLHNMRTLASMRPDKQMKIAGETDYFYAPLANRLGLFDVKTDLENLSFKYRCGLLYNDIAQSLQDEVERNRTRLDAFTAHIRNILHDNGIEAACEVYYRKPYSIYRKMIANNVDFRRVENKYYVRITFDSCSEPISEKNVCLKIYSLLTDLYTERPQTFNNQIDMQKENSYQSLNVMLLSTAGIWEDVQICSRRMVESSKRGCMAGSESNVGEWIDRFKRILMQIASEQAGSASTNFIEQVATTLYYDDVSVFTPEGRGYILPKGATAIDFAFEIDQNVGMHAKYARINGKLASLKTVLKRGDCVEIGTDKNKITPKPDWLQNCCSFKAKHTLTNYIDNILNIDYCTCSICHPLPGGEVIGFRDEDGKLTIHRRNCAEVIRLVSKHGDSVVSVDDVFQEQQDQEYPVTVLITGLDRYHLLIDIVNGITNVLHLNIESLNTSTNDELVTCTISFFVHSVREFVGTLSYLYSIDGIEEVVEIPYVKL